MIFNRLSIALLAISLTFTMCKNSDSCSIVRGGDALAFENKTFADTLFKSDSHSPEECKAIVEIDIEYPTENSLLGRSIREWIDKITSKSPLVCWFQSCVIRWRE